MRLTVVLVLAACAAHQPPPPAVEPAVTRAKPAPPARVPYAETEPIVEEPVSVPRPVIAVPPQLAAIPPADPSDHLRWPLTANRHPALEPAFAIAPVFATSTVAWTDLCRLGAQNRRTSGALTDQTEYLKAWCDVERREVGAAVARLGTLMRSPVLGLPAAVRIDIANILVDAGDADQAQRVLAATKIADLSVLDTIAASYIEVGRVSDGAQFNDLAIGAYDFQRPADQCERLTRRMLMASTRDVPDYGPYLANRSCAELAHEVTCWAVRDCGGYLSDHGIPGSVVKLMNVYFSWPEAAVDRATWSHISELAARELGTPGADLLTTAAIEAAVRSGDCDREIAGDVRYRALRVKMNETHDTALDPRLDVVIDSPWKLCDGARASGN